MNKRQLRKRVGHLLRICPTPVFATDGRLLQHNYWLLSEHAGTFELRQPGGLGFELTGDLMHSFQNPDWIILNAKTVVDGNSLDFIPTPWGHGERLVQDAERRIAEVRGPGSLLVGQAVRAIQNQAWMMPRASPSSTVLGADGF